MSCIGRDLWKKLRAPLRRVDISLHGYTECSIPIIGKTDINVSVGNLNQTLSAYAINSKVSPIFVLNWMRNFRITVGLPKEIRNDSAIPKTECNVIAHNESIMDRLNALLKIKRSFSESWNDEKSTGFPSFE